jgi:hypothetical protein
MAKIKDVKVGQIWRCKVSGFLCDVRVDSINVSNGSGYYDRRKKTTLSLTNLRTGNKVGRSAAALRHLVSSPSEGLSGAESVS